MEGPILKFSKNSDIKKFIQYLKYHNLQNILDLVDKHTALSVQYDTNYGDLVLTLYDDEQVSTVVHLTAKDALESNKLWQYFYQPEHRHDWED
jgi:allophanate hydrolase subunit 1